ncbi:unnamed protein product [Nippostrongylus brasiliensis]|uniref:Thioredoxin-1 (inferred by orthology to a C. elegans protein) n=1 Tax=Nippostrongylus brasiliensis TaxID=27835 RepID=A0A0N4YVZ5_NIPBR|nr:unnamed protein product [Nippostrongylus brasiliensis]
MLQIDLRSQPFISEHFQDEFDAILKENANSLIVIDFYATWCGPCKIMGPKFVKMSSEFTSVVFIKIDVDESEDIVSRFDIKVMPTFIFMRNGAQIVRGSKHCGFRSFAIRCC